MKRRDNMQTAAGKLCVALYEELGDVVLPAMARVYGQYGYEIGRGLAERWKPRDLAEAARAFIALCNDQGLPSSVVMKGDVGHWTGHKCPFGLENTRREVCDALMAMDRELFRGLLDLSPGRLALTIEKTLAAGDDCCQGIFHLL